MLSQADDGKILLWDPVHGNEYDVFDHHCPLQAVCAIWEAGGIVYILILNSFAV